MNSQFKIINATDLWQIETSLPSIPTFSQSLDNVLGNEGIQLGSITELLGLPGSGKTQLCLQLCASVQIPKSLGGLDAEAIYIDTNTNFSLNRFKEILHASREKCKSILNVEHSNREEALKKLHYVNAFGLEKFCSFIYSLSQVIAERPCVRLIVIDSITFPFKEGITTKRRTGLLFRLMAEVQKLAIEKHIAVVLTNEMSTRVGLSTGSLVGAFGDAWAHRCNKRLLLTAPKFLEKERLAALIKSNNSPEIVGRFQITDEGIRDL
ncbi:DNA repair protein RAD51 homolog 3-like isoform X1 [Colias croceus]|uniref:DNA repair protein RAD51 homolog 3-like isoform X1 n=1 Tax=Colias crocea TaxID=72248 RepID=UPI001E280F72|nr:DNA repair protein RAD51 homolog 3-like isoform X1 [Colias croceus]